jgi:hypothetical protein
MRVTLLSRMTQGLPAKLAARTAKQKARVKVATDRLGHEEHSLVVGLANRDTGYMAGQTRLEFTREGYNYAVGYRSEDFVGQSNTQVTPPRLITEFYPVYVVQGTRHYAGNDFLSASRRLMRPRIRAAYARALSGR